MIEPMGEHEPKCVIHKATQKDAEKLWKPGYYGEDRTYNILETLFYLFGGLL